MAGSRATTPPRPPRSRPSCSPSRWSCWSGWNSSNGGRLAVAKSVLRLITLGYLALLLFLPVGLIGWRTFAGGLSPVIDALTSDDAVHAFKVTLIVAVWAVLLNTVFGVGVALLLVRGRIPGKRMLSALIDLPLAVSPVIVGLARSE